MAEKKAAKKSASKKASGSKKRASSSKRGPSDEALVKASAANPDASLVGPKDAPRQEPAGAGHAPYAVPIGRTKEGAEVAKTAANPRESRAGVVVAHSVPNTPSDEKGLGLEDIGIESIDGSRAVLKLGKEQTRPLGQADLLALRKTLDGAVQETY